MNTSQFPVFGGLAIPPRKNIGSSAPRETLYPLDSLEVGQMFPVQITGKEGQFTNKKDGTKVALTLAEDILRKARQKQSQIAALAKRRGISVESRFYAKGADLHEALAEYSNIVAVWRVEPKPAKGANPVPTDPAASISL